MDLTWYNVQTFYCRKLKYVSIAVGVLAILIFTAYLVFSNIQIRLVSANEQTTQETPYGSSTDNGGNAFWYLEVKKNNIDIVAQVRRGK